MHVIELFGNRAYEREIKNQIRKVKITMNFNFE